MSDAASLSERGPLTATSISSHTGNDSQTTVLPLSPPRRLPDDKRTPDFFDSQAWLPTAGILWTLASRLLPAGLFVGTSSDGVAVMPWSRSLGGSAECCIHQTKRCWVMLCATGQNRDACACLISHFILYSAFSTYLQGPLL